MKNFGSSLQIGRRGFLAGSVALAGLSQMPRAAQAQPQKGGTFRLSVNQGGTSDTLNPAEASGSQQIMVGWALRNNLTEIGSDNELKPELATSWSSDDAKTWVFKLRPGVTFHNGKSLAAEDVIASLNLHRGEESTSGAKSLLAGVENIAADGADTVVFSLSAANADFPFILSDYHFQIMPVGADGALDMSGVGTGGYTLESWNPGVKTVLKRNPDYWKEGAAHFDTVELLLISDSGAATTALVTGEIDAVQSAEYKTLGLLGPRQERRDRVDLGRVPPDLRDAKLASAVHRQQRASGAEIRCRPRGAGQAGAARPWHRGERPPRRAVHAVLRSVDRTARL